MTVLDDGRTNNEIAPPRSPALEPPKQALGLPKYAHDTTRPFVGNPWDMQPEESAKTYRAFCIYRDLPYEQRSLKNVNDAYRTEQGLQPTKSVSLMSRWSRAHRWEERAAAYESYMDARRRRILERKRLDAAERHAEQAAAAVEVLSAPAVRLAARLRQQAADAGLDMFDAMSDADLLKAAKAFNSDLLAAQKGEREALGSVSTEAVADPARLQAKGLVLRKLTANPQMMQMVEAMMIEVDEEPAEPPAD